MKPLTKQEYKVYSYIRDHEGCTSHDITRDTFIQKPCARISAIRQKGIDIISIGQKKYEGTKAFEMYAIGKPLTKKKYEYRFNPYTGNMEEYEVEVPA